MRFLIRHKSAADLMSDPDIAAAVQDRARSIQRMANDTSAKIGIVTVRRNDGIRISSRGAPAVALEVGTSRQPPKRYVARALDRHEL